MTPEQTSPLGTESNKGEQEGNKKCGGTDTVTRISMSENSLKSGRSLVEVEQAKNMGYRVNLDTLDRWHRNASEGHSMMRIGHPNRMSCFKALVSVA